ncbi:peptidoglycan DD-metalloendopeptidase family protein [Paraburkholderia sp. LEh10]|uniref:peptidoglycan DD-metalloendopeptidase family protein n=1 Tax=Paraburkholderia sp. LEh10 TaxID=2821353 RepID=UPI001AE77D59|nr:peptidoglycan DD-metalloendopeptidase family protein [Paraburkholderia sp. LEh10]MBP0594853.1 peptidoglycan DD-metalloendopeptidase family protein [Paraburkholderia sp. LEh10]
MKTVKPRRLLAQRLCIASVVTALAGCASAPWDAPFADSSAASPPALMASAAVAAGYYRVNPGDTLATVALAFGREPSQVARWNRLPDDYPVSVGQVLRVAPWPGGAAGVSPSGDGGAPAVAAKRARFVWPAVGPVSARSDAGHSKGIEIGGASGETIVAADGGRVIYAGTEIKAYGLLVIIKHDKRFVSAYGNNARLLVKEGEVVRQGQPIAQMGASDNAHPYLIFEMRDGGKAVDPQNYLPKRSG